MSSKLIFRPEAELDLSEAVSWYEEKVKGLGANFLLNVEATMNLFYELQKLSLQSAKIQEEQ